MTTLTIATWNLARPGRTPNERSQAIHEQIRAVNADIWVLTETNEKTIILDGYCALATPTVPCRNEGERTTMIWSRWKMHSLPVFTDLPEREEPPRTYPSYTARSQGAAPAVCALVDAPGGPLLVYGTIITYYADKGPWKDAPAKNNAEQQLSIEAHDRDWRRLRAAHPDIPMIVAGDFDATCDARNYPTVKTCAALRDALSASTLTCLTRAHWIDHICASPALAGAATVHAPWQATYQSARAGGERPVSDHHGVSVTFAIA